MKVIAVFLILCSMLLMSCQEKTNIPSESNNTETDSIDTTAQETTFTKPGRADAISSLPENLKFNGKTVDILVSNDADKLQEIFAEQTGDVVDDAVYNRNRTVEEQLGIKINHIAIDDMNHISR